PQKRDPGDDLKYLAEQTRGKLHGRDSLVLFGDSLIISPYHFEESLLYSARKPILDKSESLRKI
ncbi:hypothetical protein ACFLXE_03665, partial [Chloroflexota bacterium]